jgi:hypothetical protein
VPLSGFIDRKFNHGIDQGILRTESHQQLKELSRAAKFAMDSRNLKYGSARAIVPIPHPTMFLLSGTGVTD